MHPGWIIGIIGIVALLVTGGIIYTSYINKDLKMEPSILPDTRIIGGKRKRKIKSKCKK